ncbi:MAG: class I SAM-dependent methyltransferase, partial [Acidobacteriales bacterium]|nr:class I SAM-dependent methyltransferase [Terriglobales bacterium]
MEPLFRNGGAALDIAGGQGRHALPLAVRNWNVSVIDISPVALSKLKQDAEALQVQVDTLVADISQCKLEVDHFDLVLLFFYSDRDVLPKVLAALKCGGVLICKLHVCSQSEARHQKPESLRDGAELRSL